MIPIHTHSNLHKTAFELCNCLSNKVNNFTSTISSCIMLKLKKEH